MDEQVKIKLSGEMQTPTLDLTQYVGKKEKISDVQILKGQYGYYLKVISTVIDVLQFGKEAKELRATKIFTLYTDEDGHTGWSNKGELAVFLKNKGVVTPEQLLGKECVVQIVNKNGKDFLTFV